MKYMIQEEDKQELLDITEMLKDENVPEWKKLVMLGYVRGLADEITFGKQQQTVAI